jgi:glyoxylate/hydroxypyruvate reductase
VSAPVNVLIASPFAPELAERIGAVDPRVNVLYEPSLLAVPRYAGDHYNRPELDEAQKARWDELVASADVMLDFDMGDLATLPQRAPRLRWLQATSAGIGELLERTGLRRSHITFTTASGVHAQALAEFALLGILYFTREVPRLREQQRAHHWERHTSRSLAGQKAVVVGLGQIGRETARMLAALNVEVVGTRRSQGAEPPPGVARLIRNEDLRTELADADAVVVACPMTEETRGLVGQAELAALPSTAVLVNVGRGGVVDEPALIQALQEGRLRGAALDVFTVEPLPADSPLWDLDNVLVSPHSASTLPQENERIVDIFVDNLRRFLDGKPLRNLYEPDRGY